MRAAAAAFQRFDDWLSRAQGEQRDVFDAPRPVGVTDALVLAVAFGVVAVVVAMQGGC